MGGGNWPIAATRSASDSGVPQMPALTTHSLPVGPASKPRLAIGTAMSAELVPEDIGRPAMVEKVADAVKAAMRDAGIDDPKDVHYGQTKTPLLTIAAVIDDEQRGHQVA